MPHLRPTIETILKTHGFSVTAQRRAVFEALHNKEAMTLRQLVAALGGCLDRASVYRTVALFERLGVIRRVTVGWKYKLELSDVFGEHHHHLACLHCHKIVAMNVEELEQVIAALGRRYGFRPVEHQIEIQGYCQACRNKAAS